MARPVIGITTGTITRGGNDTTIVSQYYDAVPQAYGRSIEAAGGLPLPFGHLGKRGLPERPGPTFPALGSFPGCL